MSLSPGTRIPSLTEMPDQADRDTFDITTELLKLQTDCIKWGASTVTGGYWRGLVEGGVLGIIAGSLVTACCLALAWSHWG